MVDFPPQPPVCEAGLRLESYTIPNSLVKASSVLKSFKPGNGRLHKYDKPGVSTGSWAAARDFLKDSWFQVNFGSWTNVTRISTQGRANGPQWVTKYKVSYSYDGIFFKDYPKVSRGLKIPNVLIAWVPRSTVNPPLT